MNGQDLDHLLTDYQRRWPVEQSVVERFRTLLSSGSNPYLRERTDAHLTGSAWIVNAAGDAAALIQHRKLGIWIQPGGHADGQTDLCAVARSEAAEEIGLVNLRLIDVLPFDIDIHHIPARPGEPEHKHFDVRFAFQADAVSEIKFNHESTDAQWVSIAALTVMSQEPSVLRMRAKWCALRRAGIAFC